MEKITEIDSYFKFDIKNNKIIFTGNSLDVYIPEFYQDRNFLFIENTIKTLGICKLVINKKFYTVLMIINMIELSLTEQETEYIDDEKYIVFHYEKNETFILDMKIIKSNKFTYDLYMNFIALGKIPKFIDYDTISSLFDNDKALLGVDLGINHSIYEMIFSYIYRDNKNPYLFYRLTPMTKPPIIISLHNINYGPESTTAKISGSFFKQGVTSSMVENKEDKDSYFVENLLRA